MSLAGKKIIIVLGVQRSGTSAIAKALSTFDTELGSNLIDQHDIVNKTGFWEDSDVLNLNKKILLYLGVEWSNLNLVTLDDFSDESLVGFFNEATQLLESKLSAEYIFTLKEPRMTKLFAFWDYVINKNDIDCKYVIALRSPNDVINSFKRLENIMVAKLEANYTHVALLWASYLVSTLPVIMSNKNYIIVDYDLLLDTPETVIENISNKFSLDINPEKLHVYCKSFINKSLNHSLNTSKVETKILIVDSLYKLLKEISSYDSSLDEKVKNKILRISHEYESLIPIISLVESYKENTNKLLISNEHEVDLLNHENKIKELEKELFLLHEHKNKCEVQILNLKEDVSYWENISKKPISLLMKKIKNWSKK